MLRRLLFLLPLAAGIVLAAAALASAGTSKSAGLVGEVGPGFSIEVKLNGKDLKTIKAGTYKLKVEDKSSIHNFHLIGKGLNKSTSLSFVGKKVWRIRLRPGRVTYQCDPHAFSGMKGSFRVIR
jgi:plastocyanin